jgi:hypothetical protein
MQKSPLAAPLRVYDAGDEFVPVYYVDKILNEQVFLGYSKPSRATTIAANFANTFGFDDYELEIVPLSERIPWAFEVHHPRPSTPIIRLQSGPAKLL